MAKKGNSKFDVVTDPQKAADKVAEIEGKAAGSAPKAASGGPKAPDSGAKRTPESAELDKANLRRIIRDLDSSITRGGLEDASLAILKKERAARHTNLEEILAQFPDSGASATPQAKPDVSKLKAAADALRAAGLTDQAQVAEAKIKELEGAAVAKPAESAKPAEAAKPKEQELTDAHKHAISLAEQTFKGSAWDATKQQIIANIKTADAARLAQIEQEIGFTKMIHGL